MFFVVHNSAGKEYIDALYEVNFKKAYMLATGRKPRPILTKYDTGRNNAPKSGPTKTNTHHTFKYPHKLTAILQAADTNEDTMTSPPTPVDDPNVTLKVAREHLAHMRKSINDSLNNDITDSGLYTPKPLAHNWAQAVFTDGCKTEVTDPKSGQQNIIIGAACYDTYGAKTKDGGTLSTQTAAGKQIRSHEQN